MNQKRKSYALPQTLLNGKKHCLFCGEECVKSSHSRNPGRQSFSKVETLEFRDNVLLRIGNSEDVKMSSIRHRILNCIDLVSVEAVYHTKCNSNLNSGKVEVPRRKSRGRPANQQISDAFKETCEWFEGIDRATSLIELHDRMCNIADENHFMYTNMVETEARGKIRRLFACHIRWLS